MTRRASSLAQSAETTRLPGLGHLIPDPERRAAAVRNLIGRVNAMTGTTCACDEPGPGCLTCNPNYAEHPDAIYCRICSRFTPTTADHDGAAHDARGADTPPSVTVAPVRGRGRSRPTHPTDDGDVPMSDPTPTPLTDAKREALNEVMIAMQSAVADHICARIHPDNDIERGPCVECSESAADLLHDGWDEHIVATRVAAARAGERERITAAIAEALKCGWHGNAITCEHVDQKLAALGQPADTDGATS